MRCSRGLGSPGRAPGLRSPLGLLGLSPAEGRRGQPRGFGRARGTVKDSCTVWTQMQMLIPKLLPKTSEVFGSRVLAGSCPSLNSWAGALSCGCWWVVMKPGGFAAVRAGWTRPQPSLCWVVPARGAGETLELPSRFLRLRSNVCHPQKDKSPQTDGPPTPGSSLPWLRQLWAVFSQVVQI